MPLVRIEILKGKDLVYKKTLLDAVHTALIKAIQIEDEDRFQRLYEVEEDLFEKSGSKTDRFTLIEITMFQGRTKLLPFWRACDRVKPNSMSAVS